MKVYLIVKQVSLSHAAEEVLEKTIQGQSKGDIIYYWAVMDMGLNKVDINRKLDFWSTCDLLNAAKCRYFILLHLLLFDLFICWFAIVALSSNMHEFSVKIRDLVAGSASQTTCILPGPTGWHMVPCHVPITYMRIGHFPCIGIP